MPQIRYFPDLIPLQLYATQIDIKNKHTTRAINKIIRTLCCPVPQNISQTKRLLTLSEDYFAIQSTRTRTRFLSKKDSSRVLCYPDSLDV